MSNYDEIYFMRLAIREARRSRHEDDRPHPYVGVVVVRDKVVLARGDQAPGDHAEFGALEKKWLPNMLNHVVQGTDAARDNKPTHRQLRRINGSCVATRKRTASRFSDSVNNFFRSDP